MRGRVIAILLAIALGGTPVGAPIVGWVADTFGPRWALGVGRGVRPARGNRRDRLSRPASASRLRADGLKHEVAGRQCGAPRPSTKVRTLVDFLTQALKQEFE